MFRILLPCLFGLEASVRKEALEAGFSPEQVLTEDGQVIILQEGLEQAAAACARMNYRSRCAERVLLELAHYPAEDYDALHDGCLAVPWEDYVDPGYAIILKGYSRKSKVYGIPSCQRVLKKAITKRLAEAWKLRGGVVPEDSSKGQFRLHFGLVNDLCSIALDTTGEGLHKRGYRPLRVEAPIKETLAAAILDLSFLERNLEHGEVVVDPFCGSGTFLIEAAMIYAGIAPGIKRHFAGEKHHILGQACFDREREYAKLLKRQPEGPIKFFGQDIDEGAVEHARLNAERAGVGELIRFRRADIRRQHADELKEWTGSERILLVCNPPYGERLLSAKDAEELLKALGRLCFEWGRLRDGMRLSLICPEEKAEYYLGAPADKTRKLYNGMIKCKFYHYFRRKGEKS